MKRMILAVLGMTAIGISGCARSLPPHDELNQAVKRSFDASGFNYSSKSRVTHLSMAKQEAKDAPDDKNLKYLQAGLDIVRAFSVNLDGALDMKNKKSEVVYDLHYNRDNLEVSIKMPLLVDYNTQTIYIGPTFLNTLLDIAVPQGTESKGKLIRIHIPDLLQEAAAESSELSRFFSAERFSSKNMDIFNNVFKAGIITSVAKLDDARFSDQPLTEQDRKAGIERRIQVKLGHGDSVAMVLELINSMSQALYQEGAISKPEYDLLLALTDRQVLDEYINSFDMAMTQEVGVARSGLVRYLESRLNIADKEGNFQIGLENISTFDRYNEPIFSISPAAGQTIDFREVLDALKTIKPKKHNAAQPPTEAPDGSALPENSGRNGTESTF